MIQNNQLSERDVRIQKMQKIEKMGIKSYAQSFDKKDLVGDIIKNYGEKEHRDINDIILNPEIQVKTAGRLMLYRSHGKLAFAKLLDSTAQIQLMFHRDNCKIDISKSQNESELLTSIPLTLAPQESAGKGDEGGLVSSIDKNINPLNPPHEGGQNPEITAYKFMEKMVDVGDFIGIRGEVFTTHKGELTIFVSEFKFLSKAVRPLPEKFHGLTDQEELYRKRYLDMTMNPETYKRFKFKSEFYKTLRDFYHAEGFTEITTPILCNAASGAAAKPFITHHNDFDTEFYLRIAFETALKKATVGRMEKVFEIGKDFRNEGSDPSHLQEFTQVEHYAVYWNYEDNMKFVEKMFDYIFDKMGLDRKINVKDKDGNVKEVDFSTPWERIDYTKGVNDASGIDITQYGVDDADKLRADIKSKGIEFERMDEMGTTTLIDYLYKKVL
ncbi:MAG TPA: amino acid--tRNA ligase-related protein, partial [Candidatus Absconditabacterales bacterium]|nr:amino acid--tRNA ligase-related protein [Candidatus Absconditabacterales bacterium]